MTDIAELAFRVDTSGMKRASTELGNLGVQGSKTTTQLTSSGRGLTTSFGDMNRTISSSADNMTRASGASSMLSTAMKGLGGVLAGISIAAVFTGAVDEAEKLQRNLLRTEQLIKSTGAAAGFSAAQLHEQARQLAFATLGSTEGIMEAQQVMLTFKSVSGDTFTRAIELAGDLATVTGGNLTGSVTQLGKALEDPISGINAMTRSGVSFTESQKEMIKSLVEAGDKASAQKLILDELATQYGGVSRNEALGYAGAIDTLGQTIQEVQQKIGKNIIENETFIGVINSVSSALIYAVENLDKIFAALSAVAVILSGRMIASVGAYIAKTVILTSTTVLSTGAALRQAPALIASGVAMNGATIAARGLAGIMALIGGPLGLLLLAATAAYAYKDELYEMSKGSQQAKKAEEEHKKVLDKIKESAYGAAGGSAELVAKLKTEGKTALTTARGNIELAKSRVTAAKAAQEAAKMAANDAQSFTMGFGNPSQDIAGAFTQVDESDSNYTASIKNLELMKVRYSEIEEDLKLVGKSAEEVRKAYGEAGKTGSKLVEATGELSGATGGLTGNTIKSISAFERQRRALEIAATAKTKGKEAAFRLALSYDKIIGKQADELVALKKQSGAWDTVKQKVTETISTYERQRRALEIATLEKTKGKEAAYRLSLSYDKITGSQADLLVSLKKQSGAWDKSKKAVAGQTDAQRAAARLIESTRTPLEIMIAKKKAYNDLLGVEGVTQDTVNRGLKAAQVEYDSTIKKVEKAKTVKKQLTSTEREALELIRNSRTAYEIMNDKIAKANSLLGVKGVKQKHVTAMIKQAREEYNKTNKVLQDKIKADKKSAEASAKVAATMRDLSHDIEYYKIKLKDGKKAAEVFAIAYEEKVNPAQAESIRLLRESGSELKKNDQVRTKLSKTISGLADKQRILNLELTKGKKASRIAEIMSDDKGVSKAGATKQYGLEQGVEKSENEIARRKKVADAIAESNKGLVLSNLLLNKGSEAKRIQQLLNDGLQKGDAERVVLSEKIAASNEKELARRKAEADAVKAVNTELNLSNILLSKGADAKRVQQLINQKIGKDNALLIVQRENTIIANDKEIEQKKKVTEALKESNQQLQIAKILTEQGSEAAKKQELIDDGIIGKANEELMQNAKRIEQYSEMQDKTKQWQDGLTNALLRGEDGLKSFFLTMIQQAAKAQLQLALFGEGGNGGGLLSGLFGGGSSSGSSGILSSLGSLFGGFRANGGDVSSSKAYIVGERGPELFTPKSSGSITSNEKLTSSNNSGSNVVVNLNEDASKAGQVEKSETDSKTIIDVFVSNIKSGGAISNAVESTYKLKRSGVFL